MNPFEFLNDERSSSEDGVPEIIQYQHEVNTSEGSEFLDDAIRMIDQPLEVHIKKRKHE